MTYAIFMAINEQQAAITDARAYVADYARSYSARVVEAASADGVEFIAAVLHDDHVFAAASSTRSASDAIAQLAGRIKSKVYG